MANGQPNSEPKSSAGASLLPRYTLKLSVAMSSLTLSLALVCLLAWRQGDDVGCKAVLVWHKLVERGDRDVYA